MLKTVLNQRDRHRVLLLAAVVIATVALIFMYAGIDNLGWLAKNSFQKILNVLVLASYAWAIGCWVWSGGRMFTFYGLFLIYLALSMAGQTLLQFFAPIKTTLDNVYTEYSMSSVNKMLLYQTGVVPLLTLGVLAGRYAFDCWARKARHQKQNGPIKTIDDQWLIIAGVLLLVMVIADAVLALRSRMTMSYGEFYYNANRGGLSSYVAFGFSVFAAYLLLRKSRLTPWVYGAFTVLIALYMIAGTRSKALPLIALCLVIYVQGRKKPIRHKLLTFLGALAALEVLGAITYLRTGSIGQLSVADYLSGGLWNNVKGMVHEIGMSAQTVTISIEKIDAGFARSLTVGYNLIVAFIPKPLLNMLGVHPPQIATLSSWITELMGSSSGYGSSMIAECYVNFGQEGWIYAFLYGGVVTFLELVAHDKVRRGYMLFPCVAYTLLGKTIFYARGQFDYFTASLRFSFVILIFYVLLTQIKHRKTNGAQIGREAPQTRGNVV